MVNGFVYINNPQPIMMSTGISLKFSGYEVVKFLTKNRVNEFRRYKRGKKWVKKRVIPLSKIHKQDVQFEFISACSSGFRGGVRKQQKSGFQT